MVMAPVRWARTATTAMRSPRPAPTGKSPARSVISSVRAGSASRVIVAMGASMPLTASSATMAIRPKTRALMAIQAASSAVVAVRRLQARRASAAMDGSTRSKASNAIMGRRTARPVHRAIRAVSHAAAAVPLRPLIPVAMAWWIRKTVKPAMMATAPPRPAPTVSRAAPSAMPPVRASPAKPSAAAMVFDNRPSSNATMATPSPRAVRMVTTTARSVMQAATPSMG